jgi:histidinol phosphatase-like enzyme (inositol monophosphatase family)
MPDRVSNAALAEFAHELADRSGAAILPHFRTALAVANKETAGFDPVTIADRDSETVMRGLIEERFPDHGIAGEEFADRPANGPYCWALDPIDGTKSFIIGMPTWGTLIGLLHDGRPVLGMMNQPYTGERFWGTADGARFRNASGERAMRTRACASLGEAILATTSPSLFKREEGPRFEQLSSAVRMTRYGGDCYLYCMVAMGCIDIVAEAGLKPFDIIPLVPIIEAAGGRVTTWDGGDPTGGGQILVTGDPSLHEAALARLRA